MKMRILGSLALVFGLAGPALALDTGTELGVTIDDEDAGTWDAVGVVRDLGDQCRYRIRWSNGLGGAATRTLRCEILERKTTNNFSCEDNRMENFPTTIEVGDRCEGFDSFLQEDEITELTAAEFSGGLAGVILFESVDEYQGFEVS
jgi:hypothetical protein